jgi:hypothetical protein
MKPETAANTDAELERALQPGSGSRASLASASIDRTPAALCDRG